MMIWALVFSTNLILNKYTIYYLLTFSNRQTKRAPVLEVDGSKNLLCEDSPGIIDGTAVGSISKNCDTIDSFWNLDLLQVL